MFIFFLRYKLIVLILAPQNLSRDVNDWMLEITRFFCYGCSYSAKKSFILNWHHTFQVCQSKNFSIASPVSRNQ